MFGRPMPRHVFWQTRVRCRSSMTVMYKQSVPKRPWEHILVNVSKVSMGLAGGACRGSPGHRCQAHGANA